MIKKSLTIVVVAVVVLIAGILGLAATKPDTFRIERSATIKARPEAIYARINDFHAWNEWSPWEKLDPAMKKTYTGSPSGKGAVYAWEGNDQVGKGRMEIQESTEPSKVVIQLDFITPFEAHNTTEFTLAPQGDDTTVTWAMSGKNDFMSKVMCVFMDMDKMVGKDFEAGLADLKNRSEK